MLPNIGRQWVNLVDGEMQADFPDSVWREKLEDLFVYARAMRVLIRGVWETYEL